LNEKDIDTLRDIALTLEMQGDFIRALKLMEVASKHRPGGNLISRKIIEYHRKIQLNHYVPIDYPKFKTCHLHIGVHKTATTYLQEHLAFALGGANDVIYIPLDVLG